MRKQAPVLTIVAVILLVTFLIGRRQDNQSQIPIATTHHTTATVHKQTYSLSDPASLWVVVNKTRPLQPIDYAPSDLQSVGNGQKMRASAADALTKLFAAAKSAGYTLIAQSGYRSYDSQTKVYASEVRGFGQARADIESARPGYSEHQTGWAVDIGSPGCHEDCFGTKPASKWLLANAYIYGFILRYPHDKSDITGYRNEPWHFRYVGTELSNDMHKAHVVTLEEFFHLPPAPDYPKS